MALMQCPDCGKQVSSRAPACPHCGAPIRGSNVEREAVTKRGGRGMKSLGFLLIAGGVIAGMYASQEHNPKAGAVAAVMVCVGFVAFIIGRFQD